MSSNKNRVIEFLNESEGLVDQKALGIALDLKPSTLSNIVKKLEAAGIIIRERKREGRTQVNYVSLKDKREVHKSKIEKPVTIIKPKIEPPKVIPVVEVQEKEIEVQTPKREVHRAKKNDLKFKEFGEFYDYIWNHPKLKKTGQSSYQIDGISFRKSAVKNMWLMMEKLKRENKI